MDNDDRSVSDVGGTPGGLGVFLLGFAMACIGGFLITNQVTVVSSYWNFWGGNSFGVTLLPMLFGVGILFWNGKSTIVTTITTTIRTATKNYHSGSSLDARPPPPPRS